MFLVAFLYALCASTFTLCKMILSIAKPFYFIGVRMLGAGLLLIVYAYSRDSSSLSIKRKDYVAFGKIILFHVYFTYMLDVWSLQYITSSKSSLLYNTSPFIAAFFSYFCFNEKITWKKCLGLCIGMLGFLPELYQISAGSGGFSVSFPELLLLGAVSSAAYGWIVVRSLVRDGGYSPLIVNGIGMVGGGVLALITSYCVEGGIGVPSTEPWLFAQLTLLIILIGNIGFYNLYGYLLKRYTATFLSFAGFVTPLFAALFGWAFLGEAVHWSLFLSVFVVCIGLYIFYQEELSQGYTKY